MKNIKTKNYIKLDKKMKSDCIFCKIIKKELPSSIIDENNDIMVIKDITPKAPIHYLIIPKKHIADMRNFGENDHELAGTLMITAQRLSQNLSAPNSFRIIVNNGKEAGQCVFHLHMHFLAGKELIDF